MDDEMHAYCDACKTWTDATIRQGKLVELKTSAVIPMTRLHVAKKDTE